MGAKIQAFDIFQTPLNSHYPLPLSQKISDIYTRLIKIPLSHRWKKGFKISPTDATWGFGTLFHIRIFISLHSWNSNKKNKVFRIDFLNQSSKSAEEKSNPLHHGAGVWKPLLMPPISSFQSFHHFLRYLEKFLIDLVTGNRSRSFSPWDSGFRFLKYGKCSSKTVTLDMSVPCILHWWRTHI